MLTFCMHLSDLLFQLVLTLLSNSNGMLAPIIIATAAHIQYFTHLLNRNGGPWEIHQRVPL
jgi:hypothetical protein